MTRSIIGGIVAIVIAALTATAYFATTGRLNGDIRKDTEARVMRARGLLERTAQLEGLGILKKAEVLANDTGLARALKADNPGDRIRESNLAFSRFKADQGDAVPDILALVDATGDIVAMDGVSRPGPTDWKKGGQKTGDILYPSLDLALKKRVIISEIWNYKGLYRVGVAPVMDPDAPVPPGDEDGVVIIGAVVMAYSLTADDARKQERLLGSDVAYFDANQVFATSFRRGGKDTEEDTEMQGKLSAELAASGLNQPGAAKVVGIGGRDYLATSLQLARFSTKPLPDKYPAPTAGAIVLMSPSDAAGGVGVVRIFILVLGLGALGVALFGMYMSNHRILNQVDAIELGVADIINGNLDRAFPPAGEETEGLANGLNVMLARLLGRPEPGDEEFDENGNPIVQGRVEFEEADESAPDQQPAADPDLAALAQEPEPDYYKRVFTEYVEGRKSIGNPDEVSFENFIAKLRVNEGKLRATYNCKAVRFRVVVKDGKVTLKPVPIFA